MKITVYTVTDCQFSKQEKEYLTSHTLQFEEKNLETNKEWLTEMLAVSNNFAGTPVTKIEKDDGQIVVLKGFTKEEFDQALGFAAPTTPADASPSAPAVEPTSPTPAAAPTEPTPPPVQPTPSVNEPLPPPLNPTPAPMDVPPAPAAPAPTMPSIPDMPATTGEAGVITQTPPVAEPPVVSTMPDMPAAPQTPGEPAAPANPQLDSLLNSLQAKANAPAPQAPAPEVPPAPQPPAGAPSIPNPDFS